MNPATSDKMVNVCLFGDSTVFGSYLPEAVRHHVVLEQRLSRRYPHQTIRVRNYADNGEFIARYLLRETYERHQADLEGIDIAIIRFGANDAKRMAMPEYGRHLRQFIRLLRNDFPGCEILLETGVFLDYPAHYSFDRNRTLLPFWNASRDLAISEGCLLADFYDSVEAETRLGNWDIRVRAKTDPDVPFVIDASQDAGRENDPAWFSDIHPNPAGVRLAVRGEVRVLQARFPDVLPAGQRRRSRPVRTSAYYAEYLDFPMERLNQKPSAFLDLLQEATPDVPARLEAACRLD